MSLTCIRNSYVTDGSFKKKLYLLDFLVNWLHLLIIIDRKNLWWKTASEDSCELGLQAQNSLWKFEILQLTFCGFNKKIVTGTSKRNSFLIARFITICMFHYLKMQLPTFISLSSKVHRFLICFTHSSFR